MKIKLIIDDLDEFLMLCAKLGGTSAAQLALAHENEERALVLVDEVRAAWKRKTGTEYERQKPGGKR